MEAMIFSSLKRAICAGVVTWACSIRSRNSSPPLGPFTFASLRSLRFREGVERHLHAFIADGMKPNLEACQHSLFRHLVQLGHFITRQAGVLRFISVGLDQR